MSGDSNHGAFEKVAARAKTMSPLQLVGVILLTLFVVALLNSCVSSVSRLFYAPVSEPSSSSGGSGSYGSYKGSGSYSSSNSSYSSSSSSSTGTLLDEDNFIDDGENTWIEMEDGDNGTYYASTDGTIIHDRPDGSSFITDGDKAGIDYDGDGGLDSYSTDGGKTWADVD